MPDDASVATARDAMTRSSSASEKRSVARTAMTKPRTVLPHDELQRVPVAVEVDVHQFLPIA